MTAALVWAAVGTIAAAIVLSPVTVAAAAALALITNAMCRGVSGAERRLLLWILVAAIVLRVAAIVALFLGSDPYQLSSFPFDGDGLFAKLRSLWIRNAWLGIPIDQSQFQTAFGDFGWTSYLYVLAYVQYLLGPAPYAVHLLSVCCVIAAAGLLYRLVRRCFGPVSALIALAFMLFLPTLFMWSVSAMRESWLLLLTTVVLVGTERVVRGHYWAVRAGWASAVVAAALTLGTTRVGWLFIVVTSLIIAITGTFVTRRAYRLAALVVLLPLLGTILLQQPWVQTRVMERLRTAAIVHLGHVNTEGYHYKLVDQRFYSGSPDQNPVLLQSMTRDEALRFMLRAMSSFVLVPLPWQSASRSQLLFIPQQLIWYGLVLLAAVGAVKAVRRDAFVAWLFIGLIGTSAVVIAPHEGNMGTLVRHRDGIVPFVICLSAIGLAFMLSSAGGVTASLVEGSAVIGRLRRLSRSAVLGRSAGVRALWHESALAAAIDEFREVEDWLWLRRLGIALLAGAAITVALGPFGRLAWPSLLVWAATAGCGLILIVYAPALVCVWREKHAPPIPIDPPSGMPAS